MSEEVRIEHLRGSDKRELVKLFTNAFEEYPFIPIQRLVPEPSPKLEEASLRYQEKMLKFVVNFYMARKSCRAYGIRKENKLVCACLSVDSKEKPSLMSVIRVIPFMISFRFYWSRLARIVGKRTVSDFRMFFRKAFSKEKPIHDDKYVELVLLGTLPAYQRQGFGRKMLRFLCDKAKEEKYKGVMLFANCDIPSFRLYLKEGFVVDKEFAFGEIKLGWMLIVF